jgi:hypothetical protein
MKTAAGQAGSALNQVQVLRETMPSPSKRPAEAFAHRLFCVRILCGYWRLSRLTLLRKRPMPGEVLIWARVAAMPLDVKADVHGTIQTDCAAVEMRG